MEGILNKSQCYHLIKCMIVDKYSMPDAFIVFSRCVLRLCHSQNHYAYQNWLHTLIVLFVLISYLIASFQRTGTVS